MFDKLKQSRLIKNVSWLFFGNILHAILSFLLNVYVARKVTLDANGLLNYALSIITFFTSIGTLGFNATITRNFSLDIDKHNTYLWTGMISRFIFSVICMIVLQTFICLNNPNDLILQGIVFCQSFSLLFGSFDLLIYWFRYQNKADITIYTKLLAFIISATWRIISISFFDSVILYSFGLSLETILYVLLLIHIYRKTYDKKIQFSFLDFKSMIRISYPFIFSAMLTTIYGQMDKIMLKNMVGNTAVALYAVSTTLAGLVVIIPTTLIEGFRPDIMESKVKNEELYQRRLSQLYAIVFWICIAYGILITIFSKQILSLLYGEKYLAASTSLSIIVWYTSFSYFGAINNVYMVAENKSKWVQLTTLVGAILNFILNFKSKKS